MIVPKHFVHFAAVTAARNSASVELVMDYVLQQQETAPPQYKRKRVSLVEFGLLQLLAWAATGADYNAKQ